MEIKSAEFVMSNSDVKKCPVSKLPEYAFIGRSNVGKSSLINMLTNRNKLAMTSSTPGKTQLINHFIVNEQWYLVDLPGYGYAKMGKAAKEQLKSIIHSYILYRDNFTCLFVLIDCRLEPQKIDMEFIEWLGENEISFSIVFTKSDKLSGKQLKENLAAYKNSLLEKWEELPTIFVTSAEKRLGRTELLDYISDVNKSLAKQ